MHDLFFKDNGKWWASFGNPFTTKKLAQKHAELIAGDIFPLKYKIVPTKIVKTRKLLKKI